MRRKPSPAGKGSKKVRIIATVRKREVEWAKSLLARMKPLVVWLATAGNELLETIRRTEGDPAMSYARLVAELEKIASGKPVVRGFEIISERRK